MEAEQELEVLEHFHLNSLVDIRLGWFDISITNLVVWMFVGAALFLLIFYLLVIRPKLYPSKRQTVAEMLVEFLKRNMIYNMMGKKNGEKWFPFVSAVFIFILSNNLVGIIPGAYTPTSNPIVPLTLALIVFFTVQIANLRSGGIRGYARTFAPRAVPSWMYVLVTPIEIVSAIAKPFSLFIRLTVNMLAGHTIIFVILGLIIYFKNYLIAIAAVPFAVVMTILEIVVSAIQAYIFGILTAMYIGEAVNPKH